MNINHKKLSVTLRYLLIVVILLFSATQCNKQEPVPFVFVNFELNIYDPDFSALQTVGGYVHLNGGYKGIIIYRRSFEEFMAYDRSCTYQPMEPCEVVTVDEKSGMYAKCDCCGSKFMLYDGMVGKGPASRALLQYEASVFDELTGTLYISNKSF